MKAWTSRTASAQHSKDLRRDLSMDILLGGLIVVGDQVGDFLYGAMLEQQTRCASKTYHAIYCRVNHFYQRHWFNLSWRRHSEQVRKWASKVRPALPHAGCWP